MSEVRNMSLRKRHVRRILNRIARKNDGYVPTLDVLESDLQQYVEDFRRYGYHACIDKDAWDKSAKCWNDP